MDRFFLDTNVLVYTFDAKAPRKQKIARDLVARALRDRNGIISYQVVQEFLNVALRKFTPPMSPPEAEEYLRRVLRPLCEVFPDAELYSDALSIASKSGWAFYDALIVASAAAGRCRILCSEDLQSGRIVRGVEIRNPFLQGASPA
jgi:predicted nucleic acid-binding protein